MLTNKRMEETHLNVFYYRKGDVSTDIPWKRPSKISFNKWLNEWSKINGINKYDLYLVGAFCQNYFLNKNLKTWDIDITLLKKSNKTNIDFIELKNILDEAIKIGFEKKLLIDIKCSLSGFEPFGKGVVYKFKPISTYIINYKTIDIITDQCRNENLAQSNITEELIPGLYKVVKDTNASADNWKKFKSKNYELPYCKLEMNDEFLL